MITFRLRKGTNMERGVKGTSDWISEEKENQRMREKKNTKAW